MSFSKGPVLNRDWIGLRVRTNREMGNRICKVPQGATGTVTHYSNGVHKITVAFDGCQSCGVSAIVSGITRYSLEVLTPESEWPNTQGKGRGYRRGQTR